MFTLTKDSNDRAERRMIIPLTLPREHDRAPVSLPNTCQEPISTQSLHYARIAVSVSGGSALVGPSISPSQHTLQLFIGPRIEIHGFHAADMGTHSPVNARAANANKDSEVPGSPSRVYSGQLSVPASIAFETPAWNRGRKYIGRKPTHVYCACSRHMSCCTRV